MRSVAVLVALLVVGALQAQAQPAGGPFLVSSLGVAVPVGAFSAQNPAGVALGLGFEVAVARHNHLGLHAELQRYGLDMGSTEWIAGLALHDRLSLGQSGLFMEAGFGFYVDQRTGNQDVEPLRHIQSVTAGTTTPISNDSLSHGIDAGLGWRLPGRNVALTAGYRLLFDQRVQDSEKLGQTQCIVIGLQAGLNLP